MSPHGPHVFLKDPEQLREFFHRSPIHTGYAVARPRILSHTPDMLVENQTVQSRSVTPRSMSSRLPKLVTVMTWVDRFFIAMQAVAGAFQLIGSFLHTEFGSNLFAWSLSGALIPAMLVAVNGLRNVRPTDRAIAYLALFGNCTWMLFILLFGKTQGSLLDVRIVLHATAAFALTVISAFQLIRRL